MWKEVSHKPARRIDTTTDRTSIVLCGKKTETLQSVEPDHLTAANWNRNRGILTVALHMGVISDPTVDNATISPVLNNIVPNGSMTL